MIATFPRATAARGATRKPEMRTDLERFFNPRSIAIIGASQDFITISGQPLKHLQSHHYKGRLYPVNPRYPEVAGVKCYASLAEVPEVPDLVLIDRKSTRLNSSHSRASRMPSSA